jgi:hypothetical protein
MSTASAPANQSMRQQLDELDALLQRMLNLPANQVDEPADPTAPRPRFNTADPSPTPPPPAGRRPAMRLLEGSAPVAAPSAPPPASWDPHWNINLNPQQGSSVFGRTPAVARSAAPEPAVPVWRAETVAFPQSEAAPAPQPVAAAPPAPMPAPPVFQSRPVAAEPTSLVLLPAIMVNRVFDAVIVHLGPPGEWLCTRAGRTILGLAGLAMIAGSAAWAAAGWFGWPG